VYASRRSHLHLITWTTAVSWLAPASAAVLTIVWVSYAVAELFHPGFYVPRPLLYQGAALAATFAGYALGWRWRLAGGLLIVAGTAAFFAISFLNDGAWPPLETALFAAPGMLYLEAWRRERRDTRR
jgi:hypothetical protein